MQELFCLLHIWGLSEVLQIVCISPCTKFLTHFFRHLNRREQKLETKALSVIFLK